MLMWLWDPTADNSTFFPVGARHVLLKTLAGKVEKDVPNRIIIQLAELLQTDNTYIRNALREKNGTGNGIEKSIKLVDKVLKSR